MSQPTKQQLQVRLPISLHHALVQRAAQEGVSLNSLLATLLAGAISFKLDEQRQREETSA